MPPSDLPYRREAESREFANQPVTGISDSSLRTWLESRTEPFPPLDTNGVAFIALEETGGLNYYYTHTRWPHFPGEDSGITIGVGYDLRMNSEEDFREKWGKYFSDSVLTELSKDIGKRGIMARVARSLFKMMLEITFPTYLFI